MRIIIVFFFLFQIPLNGQDYYSKLIPFHIQNINPNQADLNIFNNEILIPVIYNNEQSSLIRLNLFGEVINLHAFPLFVLSADAISVIDNNICTVMIEYSF